MQNDGFRSFAEFWPYYLGEHSRPATRNLHFAGTLAAVAIAAYAAVRGEWMLMWLVPLASYGAAWGAHFLIERNRPATFRYPLWSLRGDFRMLALWLSGRLGGELKRCGIGPDASRVRP